MECEFAILYCDDKASNFFIVFVYANLHHSLSFVVSNCSNTVGGSFGDGESKVVRNLTKPPMVNNILEFISEFDLSLFGYQLRSFHLV